MIMKKLLAILMVLSLLLSVSAVFAEGEAEAPAAETEAQADPVLLVTVYGKEITDQSPELLALIDNITAYYAQYGYDTSDPGFADYAKQFALQYLYEEALLLNKAKELGMDTLTDEEKASIAQKTSEEFEEEVQYYLENYFKITDESSQEDKDNARAQLLALFESDGYTLEAAIQQAEQQEIENHVRASATKGVEASEQEIIEYFNTLVEADKEASETDPAEYVQNREMYEQYSAYYPGYFSPSYYIPANYRGILHILLKPEDTLLENWKGLSARLEENSSEEESTAGTDPETAAAPDGTDAEATAAPEATEEPVTAEMVEAARQAILDSLKVKIDDIQARLAKGESFESLIAEYGEDPGMEDPETLKTGYIIHPESIVYAAPFTKAAAALEKVGDISEPVLTDFGVHILYYLRDIEPGPVELTDAMKAELKSALDTALQDEAYDMALGNWTKEAEDAGAVVWTEAGNAWISPEEVNGAEDAETIPETEGVPAPQE